MSALFYVSYGALWLLLLVIGVLLLLLYRHFGVVALSTLEGVQRDGLPIGEVAPAMSAVTPDGAPTTWAPQRGRPELLLFAAPDCEPCATVLPTVRQLAVANNGRGVAVTAVVPGPSQMAAEIAAKFDLPFPCLADDANGAFERYRVRVTPFAFVIGQDGRILAKGLCSDAGRLRDLFAAGGLDEPAAALATTIRLVRRDPIAAVESEGVTP